MRLSNSNSVIDSRDIIERIAELEDEEQSLLESIESAEEGDEKFRAMDAMDTWDDGELERLRSLAEEGEASPDWPYSVTLIRESYFVEYCREMVADIGDLPKDIPGYIVIDWDATAENLKADYTEVDFDGVTYLVR
jgi:hypothetical protein